jgi:hypothetical protein
MNVESSHTLFVGWDLNMECLGLLRPSTSTSRTHKWRNYITKSELKAINKNIDCHDRLNCRNCKSEWQQKNDYNENMLLIHI